MLMRNIERRKESMSIKPVKTTVFQMVKLNDINIPTNK